MAIPTNTRESYTALGPGRDENPWTYPGGIREDLSDIIYNISPEETPFMSSIGRSSADNTYFEWQTDSLADPVDNRQLEGDDASALEVVEPIRYGNYTQISTKTVRSSGTAEAVDFAGRKSTQAYQMAKRAKELKLDMEAMLLSLDVMSPGASTPPSTGARVTAGVGAWVQSNLVNATATADEHDYGKIAPSAGALAPVTEDDIRDAMEQCWNAGAKPTVIMVNGKIKQAISALSQSVSELRTAANNKSPAYVVAAVDIYVSDFGNLQIVPNRLMPDNTAYLLDYDFWDVAYLRPFSTHELARTGDSIAQQLIVEYGLRARNEKANAAIHGWDPTAVAP
jgi:hypothetical protein